MTAITTNPAQKRLGSCVLNTLRWAKIVGNLHEYACRGREAATTADVPGAGLENNGKIC